MWWFALGVDGISRGFEPPFCFEDPERVNEAVENIKINPGDAGYGAFAKCISM